jgi:multicomponent Na+:H+ antiporter subunit D
MLFLSAFGTKAALFPFFNWLPASYYTPPAVVSALFAGMLTEVGVYALIRVFTLLFQSGIPHLQPLLFLLAGATMIAGAVGALSQAHFGRMLCFLVVSQTGFMIMGLGVFTHAGLAGSIFYILHDAFVKANLFLIYGIAGRISGTHTLDRMGGLIASHPGVSTVYLVSALSLAGVPPLSGFFAKVSLIQAAVAAEQFAIVAAALASSLLVLYAVLRIWSEAFWKPRPKGVSRHRPARTAMASVIVLASLSVVLGAGSEPVFNLCLQAAGQLMDPSAYFQTLSGLHP